PALQIIILGSGGGPLENNTTAILVRAVASGWQKCSMVAVDAGVHLAAIVQILESTQPPDLASLPLPHTLEAGPFAGLQLHSASTHVNAAHIARSLVDTYLITHPHLDHIAGFVVNTAGVPGGPRPKRLAGLPATIEAFKQHIFNNVIWPNLSDENGGVGLVTYTRLVDGGSSAIGDGDARGYLEVAEGLSVKACSISHGSPIEPPPPPAQRGSLSSTPAHTFPRSTHNPSATPQTRVASCPYIFQQPPNLLDAQPPPPPAPAGPVYDSTVYFLRDSATGCEILAFGDVEPDALSSVPRNLGIWTEAAPKFARGALRAILLECSYDDSQSTDRLFGHMKPSFVMEELRTLAREVDMVRCLSNAESAKRKRLQVDCDAAVSARRKTGPEFTSDAGEARGFDSEAVSPKTVRSRFNSQQDDAVALQEQARSGTGTPYLSAPTAELSLKDVVARDIRLPLPFYDGVDRAESTAVRPLEGLKVIIIHVKNKLDGVDQGATIMKELQAHEEEAQTGVEFILSYAGQSIYV
ncbi:hypothetical protein ACRALDRAFT_2074580, partial [Sodiomyces alcalophilus JCM 7366]|uniref:uncharacterized protein n=1 Tax=Sodiomyces alcalophilus JCM 7366 TaxID=591952 RepID=UPI0039B50DA5